MLALFWLLFGSKEGEKCIFGAENYLGTGQCFWGLSRKEKEVEDDQIDNIRSLNPVARRNTMRSRRSGVQDSAPVSPILQLRVT